MSGVSQILSKIESSDHQPPEELLQLVYHKLGRLAAAWMANQRDGPYNGMHALQNVFGKRVGAKLDCLSIKLLSKSRDAMLWLW